MFSVDLNGVVRIVETRSRPQGWEDISIELLETIFDYLPQHRELLPMRVVSRYWNSTVRSVLERRTLQQWTVWQPFVYDILSISPYPFLNLGTREDGDLQRVDYRYYSTLFEDLDANPFPSNSLHVLAYSPGLQYSIAEYAIHGFLSNHGVHLTSVKLNVSDVTPIRFYGILQQMPNLKAFTLYLSRVSNPSRHLHEDEKIRPSPCPKLKYLRICGNWRESPAQCMWLLKLFATQLVSLELYCIDFGQLDIAFKNLQRLKVIYPATEGFMTAVTNFRAPLQMLTLHQDCPQWISVTELLRFMLNFSDSLVHLSLTLDDIQDDVEEVMIYPVTSELCPDFPKVKKFAVEFFHLRSVQTFVRKHFQPRLTNLVTLQLLSFHDHLESNASEDERKKEAVDFCKNAGLWMQFLKLKTIEIYPLNESVLDQILSFVLTRDD